MLGILDKKMDYETNFCKWLKEDQEGRLVCIQYNVDCHPEIPGCNSPQKKSDQKKNVITEW